MRGSEAAASVLKAIASSQCKEFLRPSRVAVLVFGCQTTVDEWEGNHVVDCMATTKGGQCLPQTIFPFRKGLLAIGEIVQGALLVNNPEYKSLLALERIVYARNGRIRYRIAAS